MSASVAVEMPGAMAPPQNAPAAFTQSNVVAVPRSTMISGGPYSATAATDLVIRSAPISSGLSTARGIVSFTPGSTEYGATLKYFSHIDSSVCCTGGTTLESATPSIWRGSMPRVRSRVSMKRPYSSAVCSRRLVSRHDTRRRSPSYTPTFVLVLPTSSTSSNSDDSQLAGHHAMPPPADLQHERAVGVEVHGHPGDAVHRDAATDRVRERQPARAHRREAVALQLRAPAVEGLEQRRQRPVALDYLAGLEQDRRRAFGEPRPTRALAQVDPDADGDHAHRPGRAGAAGGRHAALEEDAGDHS